MNSTSIEVTIEGGRITPVHPQLLPEQGRGWLTISSESTPPRPSVRIETTEDGLPIIRGDGPVITSKLVRELEASGM